MNRIILDSFIYFLLIVITILLYQNLEEIKKDSISCVVNPLVYGIKKLSESNNADLTCVCNLAKPNYPSLIITKNGIQFLKTESSSIYPNLNLSKINIS